MTLRFACPITIDRSVRDGWAPDSPRFQRCDFRLTTPDSYQVGLTPQRQPYSTHVVETMFRHWEADHLDADWLPLLKDPEAS